MKFHANAPSGTSLKRTVNATGTGATGAGVSVVKTSDRRRSPGRSPVESNDTVTGSVLPPPPPEAGIVPDAGSSESHGMSVTHQPGSPDSTSSTLPWKMPYTQR